MSSNFINFIRVEELANVLAVFSRSLTGSPDSDIFIGKACHCLEIVCAPSAYAFKLNTGRSVIPWECDDILFAYKELKCSNTKSNADDALKLLIRISNQWVSNSGTDFSTRTVFRELAFLIHNIAQYSIEQ